MYAIPKDINKYVQPPYHNTAILTNWRLLRVPFLCQIKAQSVHNTRPQWLWSQFLCSFSHFLQTVLRLRDNVMQIIKSTLWRRFPVLYVDQLSNTNSKLTSKLNIHVVHASRPCTDIHSSASHNLLRIMLWLPIGHALNLQLDKSWCCFYC